MSIMSFAKYSSIIFSMLLFPAVPALALSLDLPGAHFKSGRPVEGEGLLDSLDPARAAESLDNLRTTADRLAQYSGIYFEVAGHADTNECEGRECYYLSSRRARLVFRHLLELGVDPMRLDGLSGWGARAPINSDPQSEDVWLNRRVDINVSN